PSPMMVPLVLPLPSRGQRLPRDMMSGLPWGLSACCLRFMRDVAMPMQDSLPAGWLTFAERELNPLGRDERFPSSYISSPFPGFILTRREFITTGSAAVAWPLAALAQQPKRLPVVGLVASSAPIVDMDGSNPTAQ